MNRKNRPKAGFADRNAPHSTLQLGYHSPAPTEFLSRQELRARLRDKGKLDAAAVRVVSGEKRIPLDRRQRDYLADAMCDRWLAQINKACEKETLVKTHTEVDTRGNAVQLSDRYPRYLVEQVMMMQNVHDDVIKEALGL